MRKINGPLFAAFFCALIALTSFSGLSKIGVYSTIFTTPDLTLTEYINYDRKEITENWFSVPSYTCEYNRSACGAVSGAIICGYYDCFYPNLVPNFVTYFMPPPDIGYYSSGTHINRLINNLIVAMCISNTGCTVAQYKNGLSDYFKLFAGLTVNYSSVKSGTAVNYGACKTQLNAGKPIALFLSSYSVVRQAGKEVGQDIVESDIYINNHIVTAFGYRTVEYYRIEDGIEILFRTDNYLYVETGWEYYALLDTGRNITLNDACAIGVA